MQFFNIYFFSVYFYVTFLFLFLLVKWPFSNFQNMMTLHHCFAEVCFLGLAREVIYVALLQFKEGISKSY